MYFLAWRIGGKNLGREDWPLAEIGYIAVTPAHPVWVRRKFEYGSDIGVDVRAWMSIEELYQINWNRVVVEQTGEFEFEFELHDGRYARSLYLEPILKGSESDVGVTFSDDEYWPDNSFGFEVTFSASGPLTRCHERGYGYAKRFLTVDELLPDLSQYPENSISSRSGYTQMRRTVFNLEVECNHTYYVGEMGLLVHNTSDIEKWFATRFEPARLAQ